MKDTRETRLPLRAPLLTFLAGALLGFFVSAAFRGYLWSGGWRLSASCTLAGGVLVLFSSLRGLARGGGRNALPYAGLLIPAFFLPDYLVGEGPPPAVSLAVLGLSLSCLFVLKFLLVSNSAPRFEDWMSRRSFPLAATASLLFMAFVIACGVTKYLHFAFPGSDLGCFMQSFWTALHGHLFRNSYELFPAFGSHLGKHFSAIMFLLVPFFAVLPHCTTFFVLSAAGLGLGSLVLFLLARDSLGKYCALCFSISYLLYPGISYQAWFPYYFMHFAPLFLLLSLYFFRRERLGLFSLSLLLACSTREEVSLTVLLFGLYALIERRSVSWILLPLLLGAGWFFLSMRVIIPALGPGTMWEFYVDTGGSLDGVLVSLFSSPASVLQRFLSPDYLKLLYLILMPLGVALPLLGPEIIFSLPTLVILALSSRDQTRVIYGYYFLPLVPFVFAAAITAVRRLSSRPGASSLDMRTARNLICTFVLFLSTAVFVRGPAVETLSHGLTRPFNARSGPGDSETLRRVVGMVPPTAPVFAPRYLMPNLAKRMRILPNSPLGAEYLIIDTGTEDAWTEAVQSGALIEGLDADDSYEKLFDENGVKLYRRRGR